MDNVDGRVICEVIGCCNVSDLCAKLKVFLFHVYLTARVYFLCYLYDWEITGSLGFGDLSC